jgi:hypothetical protein
MLSHATTQPEGLLPRNSTKAMALAVELASKMLWWQAHLACQSTARGSPDALATTTFLKPTQRPEPWLWLSSSEVILERMLRSFTGLIIVQIVWVGVFQYCLMRVLMTIVAVVARKTPQHALQSIILH